jgi:hypothetical protein
MGVSFYMKGDYGDYGIISTEKNKANSKPILSFIVLRTANGFPSSRE